MYVLDKEKQIYKLKSMISFDEAFNAIQRDRFVAFSDLAVT